MMAILKWSVPVLLLAALVHVLAVLALPEIAMSRVHGAVAGQVPVNTELHAPRATAQSRTVVRPSPDLLYTICAFDMAEGPMRVRATVPDAMWSLAFYDDRGDNFFGLDDRAAGGPGAEVDLVLTRPGDPVPARLGHRTIEAASFEGVVLIRTLIDGEARLEEIDTARRAARCRPFDPREDARP
jgi:uncharacterized membrane protein